MSDEDLSYEDKIAIERAHFRGRLHSTASQPDFAKPGIIGVHLKENLHLGGFMPPDANGRIMPLEEMFREVYGPGGSDIFWHAECSIIRKMKRVVDLFWLTNERPGVREDATRMAVPGAILTARQMGEPWIIAEASVFVGAQHGWQIRADRVQIDIRAAALWLLSKPPFRHLVPDTLARFVAGPEIAELPQALSAERILGPEAPKTGPRPDVLCAVANAMRAELAAGTINAAGLQNLKKKEMPSRFGGKETTCLKARSLVLRTASNSARTAPNDK